MVLEYIDDKPEVVIISVLYDEYQPYSCSAWANGGNSSLPIMINGGVSLTQQGQNTLESLFFNETQIPKRVFIDHELKVHSKFVGYQSHEDIKEIIDEMLTNMEIN
tara:strand:+ start:352 stop:669 length:318 start_codon:yes stop_codon:yes gene_type:complete